MAIVLPETVCPICQKTIEAEQNYFATSAFLDLSDVLYRFSDAAMHWDCYANWIHRNNFAYKYAQVIQNEERKNPFWHEIMSNDIVFVRYGEVGKIDILLRRLAVHLQVPFAEFNTWLKQPNLGNQYIQHEFHNAKPYLDELKSLENIYALLKMQENRIQSKKMAFNL